MAPVILYPFYPLEPIIVASKFQNFQRCLLGTFGVARANSDSLKLPFSNRAARCSIVFILLGAESTAGSKEKVFDIRGLLAFSL